jgi:hypothetical protein
VHFHLDQAQYPDLYQDLDLDQAQYPDPYQDLDPPQFVLRQSFMLFTNAKRDLDRIAQISLACTPISAIPA